MRPTAPTATGREYRCLDGRRVVVQQSTRADGDLGSASAEPGLAARRQAVYPGRWTWLRQVHGARVVTVRSPGEACGEEADAAVTAASGAVLAVQSADCVPLALWSPQGVVGVAHAGWRGLVAGVVAATVAAMVDLGARQVHAIVGACIGPACYEFGAADLDLVVAASAPAARAQTSAGRPALDLLAATEAQLGRLGVDLDRSRWSCTACGGGFYSHRARQDKGRQALIVALEASSGAASDGC